MAERYLRKGSKVYIEGKLQTRKWQDQSGNDRYSTEIVVGMGGNLTMLDGAQGGQRDAAPSKSASTPAKSIHDDLNDDVPF